MVQNIFLTWELLQRSCIFLQNIIRCVYILINCKSIILSQNKLNETSSLAANKWTDQDFEDRDGEILY